MSAITGKEGIIIYKTVPVFRINSWDIQVNTDMRDHTSFTTDTLQWRVMAPGLSGAAGSASGFWDPEGSTAQKDFMDAALSASTGDIVLQSSKTAGDSLTGAVYVNGFGAASAVDGDATADFNFTFNGAVTYSTTT